MVYIKMKILLFVRKGIKTFLKNNLRNLLNFIRIRIYSGKRFIDASKWIHNTLSNLKQLFVSMKIILKDQSVKICFFKGFFLGSFLIPTY